MLRTNWRTWHRPHGWRPIHIRSKRTSNQDWVQPHLVVWRSSFHTSAQVSGTGGCLKTNMPRSSMPRLLTAPECHPAFQVRQQSVPSITVAMVTSNGYNPEELDDLGDDPFVVGWWVGPDGNWHPPDEPFGAETAKKPHPLRRVVVVLLAVAIVVATTVSVFARGSSPASSIGPSLGELSYQVQQAVTGSGSGQSVVQGVTSVKCHLPSTWSSGQTFTCDVFGTSQKELGQYHGTVQPTASSGAWRWEGVWKPKYQYTVT